MLYFFGRINGGGDVLLCEKFLHLHRLCVSNNISVFSSMAFSPPSMNWNWKFNFKINLNDREIEERATLMLSIEKCQYC